MVRRGKSHPGSATKGAAKTERFDHGTGLWQAASTEKSEKLVREDDEDEEINPGMLLTDFIEESPASLKAAKKSKAGKVKKLTKKKRPSAAVVEADDADLLTFGPDNEGDEAGASAKLIGAISLATSSRDGPSVIGRHAEEALPESEFHAGGGGEDISMEDLLAPLQDSAGFSDVKKLLQGVSKKEAMPEPVSDVAQGREERGARYKVSSHDAGKWIPQIQRMRKADQVTLGEEDDQRPSSTSALVATFNAKDDFEKELEEVTKAAGATEQNLIDSKGLPMNSRIRDAKQIQQIAKLKALMLREQQANKRLKKIKSKAYHRIHRKAQTREREVLLERLERENPELAKSLKQDYEKKHAERRMLRQRNSRKKWAQTMQRFAKNDDSAKKEITKQAQDHRDEDVALRRVIAGRDADQSDDSEAMDMSDSDDDGQGRKKSESQKTLDKARKLTLSELSDLKKEDGDLPTTGIFGLGFMRNAIKQKREAAKAEAQTVLNELEGLGARLEDDAASSDDEGGGNKLKRKAAKDKAKSQPAETTPKKREFTAEELEEAGKEVDLLLEQEDATQSQGISVSGPLTVKGVEKQDLSGIAGQSSSSSSSAVPKTKVVGTHTYKDQSVTHGASSTQSPDAKSPKSKAADRRSPRMKAAEPANPWEENPWLAAEQPAADEPTPSASSTKKPEKAGAAASAEPGSRQRKRKRSNKKPEAQEQGEDDDKVAGADLLNVLDADAEAARQQRDLVRATFVEGTQAEDFDDERDEKERELEERDKPVQLVGWGSWTGAGVKPHTPKGKGQGKGKKKEKEKQHTTPKPAHVQVYEGGAADKAQAKYFVDKVPFPFKSPQQYNQEMRMPSGPEWNTLAGHLQRVKPKIFSKVGAIVPPLQYVKHLEPEQRESAIETWAKPKQPKRLKARF